MEKSQYELCIEVLRRLDKAGILGDIVLIGSWCIPFYKEYFSDIRNNEVRSQYSINTLLKVKI